ncbi:MAG: hypothetical protein LBC09_06500 [Helicobacteraceae bacterium]|jgi:hypothetical protein|nr:hypothetical protein [Helicobacteraceae bacterium]
MKKLTVLAFLAALGLFAVGCGDQAADGSVVGGASGSSGGSSGTGGGSNPADVNTPPTVGADGYTDKTVYVDPETGEKTAKIGDIVSDATGATPPQAPTFVRPSGKTPVPAPF